MRKDILPQLAENLNHPAFDAYEDKPKFALQNCMNSGKKERNSKPRLRRLQLEDSFAKNMNEEKVQEEKGSEVSTGYGLRSRKRPFGAITEKIANSPNIFRVGKRGSQSEQLIDRLKEVKTQSFSPGCFGSAKKSRKEGGT